MGGMADSATFLHRLVDRFLLEILFLLGMTFKAEIRSLGNEFLRIRTGHLVAAPAFLKHLVGL